MPNIESRLRMLRMDVMPGLRINFKPSERNLEDAFQFGMDFAKRILQKKPPNPSRNGGAWCADIFMKEKSRQPFALPVV